MIERVLVVLIVAAGLWLLWWAFDRLEDGDD